jgi:carbon starvation protein
MFTTTLTASAQLIEIFMDKAAIAANRTEALTFQIDAFLMLLMATLAVVSLLDMLHKWYGHLSGKNRTPSSEVLVT